MRDWVTGTGSASRQSFEDVRASETSGIYPNPLTDGDFTIPLKNIVGKGKANISIINSNGREITKLPLRRMSLK